MLRTYFQQNEDWFSNPDHPLPRIGDMESEIAELRTISKVTRLRKQIECREEGAWMVVKDVPDESVPSGSRKVTAYGRTRRSVVRSITTNSNFDNGFHDSGPGEPFVQHPSEDNDFSDPKPSSVEITEVFEEPLRGNIIEIEKPSKSEASKKKTSVVTLGEGNLVLIDPEKESNFHVTGISKGKVADVVSTLERTTEKKPKKVGFCKTEVHFAPDSGKINIVETDEKPPPTQVYRRKKRPRSTRRNNCLPKHYFGDMSDLGDDSNQSNESDKDDPRPVGPPPSIEAIPQVKEIFPAFEKTIKSEGKDVKYRHSSPEKSDNDFNVDKLQFDEKEFFRKLKQPSFRERYLKENETTTDKSTVKYTSFGQGISSEFNKPAKQISHFVSSITSVNGLISRHNQFSQDKFSSFSSSHKKDTNQEREVSVEPELKYTELFKVPVIVESDDDSPKEPRDFKDISNKTNVLNNEEVDQSNYGFLNKHTSLVEGQDDVYNISKVPLDQDIKPDVAFLGNMSPKLQSLIQNSVEHEFQLRQKQILQKRTLEQKSSKESNKIKSSVNIRLPTQSDKEEKSEVLEDSKLKVTPNVGINRQASSKHEFQLKKEEITKNIFSEPIYSNKKDFEVKEMPYLLNEEPVPAPREKISNCNNTPSNTTPPKPKPRTIISPERPRTSKTSSRHSTGKHSSKSDTSSLSRRTRSKECLNKSRESERTYSKINHFREDIKPKNSGKPDGGLQRLSKTSAQVHTPRKTVRGEPLRSFEKVSNGWVGVVPTAKKEEREASKVIVTSRTYANKAVSQQSSHHTSGVRKSTYNGSVRSSNSEVKGESKVKQFSLSKEHLSSAKLVKEVSPRRPTARVRPEVRVVQTKTTTYGRLRRDSNDSVTQADEEVRAYMFRSPPKALLSSSPATLTKMSGGEMDEMTASYTEICDGEGGAENRPSQLELLNRLEGTVATEEGASGPMVTFVAGDLETKLRLASPRGVLAALESEACALAASVDSLTESLADALHGISAMTVECLEAYASVVTKTSDAVDANIKAMYQLMAKSEELSMAMAPLYRLSTNIKNIKHLLDLIEASPSLL